MLVAKYEVCEIFSISLLSKNNSCFIKIEIFKKLNKEQEKELIEHLKDFLEWLSLKLN
ncbi:MAG: hypothetical protein LWW95_08215 [Candidatus Desulfofervidus auxilii]|nr:hypothetical protein [Candidatus Desulfofervidus auxilii]